MNTHTPAGDGWGKEPSESEVFAASEPFVSDVFGSSDDPFGSEPFAGGSDGIGSFAGVDAFAPDGPVPMFGAAPTTSIHHATCIEVHRSLTFYLDGELAHGQELTVREHLRLCPPCQSAQAFQMQLRTVVARKAIDPIPDDARARILRALGFD